MRITGVRAHLLTCTLEEPFEMRFALGKRTVFKRDAMIIEVGTDEGITGWGSGDPGDMGNRSWTPRVVAAQIGKGIGAILEARIRWPSTRSGARSERRADSTGSG